MRRSIPDRCLESAGRCRRGPPRRAWRRSPRDTRRRRPSAPPSRAPTRARRRRRCNGRSSTRRCRSYPVPTRPIASDARRAATRSSSVVIFTFPGILLPRREPDGRRARRATPRRWRRRRIVRARRPPRALRDGIPAASGRGRSVSRGDRFDDERAVRMTLDPLDRVAALRARQSRHHARPRPRSCAR